MSFSVSDLAERMLHRRAVEAVNWNIPAVNLEKMQTLTPNPDVIYLKPFFNTRDVGPMVLEIPPANGARSPAPSWMPGKPRCGRRRRQGWRPVAGCPAAG
jgi:hypothetical protein